MSKKIKSVKTEPVEMTPKEKKIKALKDEIKDLKDTGTFKKAYRDVRKATIDIMKSDYTEQEKKDRLAMILADVSQELSMGDLNDK